MNFFVVTLFSFFLAIQASPLFAPRATLNNLDVWVPEIITPNEHSVWFIGQKETVTWKTDDKPELISNGAHIYLVSTDRSIRIPLADHFDLTTGSKDVVVPTNISPGEYHITLFGDSGNDSKSFRVLPYRKA
jgi:hypothetical protein